MLTIFLISQSYDMISIIYSTKHIGHWKANSYVGTFGEKNNTSIYDNIFKCKYIFHDNRYVNE